MGADPFRSRRGIQSTSENCSGHRIYCDRQARCLCCDTQAAAAYVFCQLLSQLKGSSSSMPSGIFINPSSVSDAGAADWFCAGALYPPPAFP